jgi:hypothetical protein
MMGMTMKNKFDEDKYLFPKELRDTLKPFGHMTAKECIESVDFMKTLCLHAGMSEEKFNEILNDDN